MQLMPCTHCLMRKKQRTPFKKFSPSEKVIFLICFTPIFALKMPNVMVQCTMLFFYDHYRKVWTFPLKTKTQVLDVFKALHMKDERKIEIHLKCARANSVDEYIGPFEEYYRSHDIRVEKIVPKMPQQNGVVKNINIAFCEKSRCMLSQKHYLIPFRVKE